MLFRSADRFRYRQETQAELLTQQFAGDYTSGTLLSGSTSKFVTSLAFPQRKFSYISFVDADFPLDQVKDYAQKNKALFRTINLSRITVTASEAEAKKVHDEAVKCVKTFEELAKTYSKDPLAETGGALNSRAYYELKSEITKIENLDKVYGLAKGGVSDVFSNGSNWTFYKVVEASRDADLTATATLDLSRSYIEKNDRGLVEDYLEIKAKEFQVAATSNFDAAAKALGKSVQKTEWVSLNFGNDDLFNSLSSATKDSVIQGQSANEDFFKKAFRTADKGVTAPILTGTVVLVMRVD